MVIAKLQSKDSIFVKLFSAGKHQHQYYNTISYTSFENWNFGEIDYLFHFIIVTDLAFGRFYPDKPGN